MIFLSKNLKFLRKKQGMGQGELAKLLDIKSNTISNYENEVSTPDYSMLEKIISLFHVSAHDILYTDIEVASQTDKSRILINEEVDSAIQHKKTAYSIVADTEHGYISDNIISIPIVDVSAAAGHGYFNPDHPETLGELSFPVNLLRKKYGNYYCGRVNGESMAPTLLNQDFIIFRLLQFDEWISIKDNEVYFIVDRSGTSCVKRVKNQLKKEKTILCMSDNLDKTNFRDFTIPGEEIANIYHVEWRFSKDMTDINKTFFSRVDDIEDRLKNVENLLKKK